MLLKHAPSVWKYRAYPSNSHVRKYSVYPQNLCTVLTQIFTNVESFTAEMHKLSSNLTVKNDKLIDNFIFAVMPSPSTWSSSGVQAGACKIVNSLDWAIPELKHPTPKKTASSVPNQAALTREAYCTFTQPHASVLEKTDWTLPSKLFQWFAWCFINILSFCTFESKFWLFIFYYWWTELTTSWNDSFNCLTCDFQNSLSASFNTSRQILRLLLSPIFHY